VRLILALNEGRPTDRAAIRAEHRPTAADCRLPPMILSETGLHLRPGLSTIPSQAIARAPKPQPSRRGWSMVHRFVMGCLRNPMHVFSRGAAKPLILLAILAAGARSNSDLFLRTKITTQKAACSEFCSACELG
jgi:hypothetical protein